MDSPISREQWRECLDRKCEVLVEYLQVEDGTLVYGSLARNIINDQQGADIMARRTHYEKARQFREILLRINREHYLPFLQLLHQLQSDLAEDLAEFLGVKDRIIPKSDQPVTSEESRVKQQLDKTGQRGILKLMQNKRNEELIKMIINLEHWQDLECNGLRIMDLLGTATFDVVTPTHKPSLFMRMIRKAEDLIESGFYNGVIEAMIPNYQKYQKDLQEDPLQGIVSELERGFPNALIEKHQKFLELIKILLPLNTSDDTRSRCFMVLIRRTEEWKLSKGEIRPEEMSAAKNTWSSDKPLQWDVDLVEVLEKLVAEGADPAWAPSDLIEGSNLHVFLMAIHHVIACKSHLFTSLLEFLKVLMTERSVHFSNVDNDRKTILHALVDGDAKHIRTDCAEQISQIAKVIRLRNPDLLDAIDAFQNCPLHTFVFGVFRKHKDNLSPVVLKFVNSIVPVLKSDSNVNITNERDTTLLHFVVKTLSPYQSKEVKEEFLQLLNYIKSSRNLQIQDKCGKTVLHLLAHNAEVWAASANFFLQMVESFANPININIKDHQSRTALFIFTSMAGHWSKQNETFLEVLKYLVSPCNVDSRAVKQQTALHLFVSIGTYCVDETRTYIEVVKNLRSLSNVDFQDACGQTPMHLFIASRSDWLNQEHLFSEVIKCLRSPSNIDFQDMHGQHGQTSLYLFISMGINWREHTDTFVETVKYLRSPFNVDFQDKNGQTALHLFISMGMYWDEHTEVFLEVVRCLRSPSNVDLKNKHGQTPRDIFCAMELYQKPTEMNNEVLKYLSP